MLAPDAASALHGGARSPRRTSQTIRLTHLDGKQPNLALMKLAAYHKALGDRVVFTRNPQRDLFEPDYDRVYGSAIFTRSAPLITRLQTDFPGAIVGGTGTASTQTVDELIGPVFDNLDYSLYPTRSIRGKTVPEDRSFGFVSRGCRFRCGHCVVPRKEGRACASGTIGEIYRGEPYPKHIVLLDNDFFGVEPDIWRDALPRSATETIASRSTKASTCACCPPNKRRPSRLSTTPTAISRSAHSIPRSRPSMTNAFSDAASNGLQADP